MRLPLKVEDLRAGDSFWQESNGAYIQCLALTSPKQSATGWSFQAKTPLGERELFQACGGRPLRLFGPEQGKGSEKPAIEPR